MNLAVDPDNRFDGRSEIGQICPKRLFITGGTGFFGKSMLDYRLRHPEWPWAQAEWVILSRSPERFAATCPRLATQPGVSFAAGDVRDFALLEGSSFIVSKGCTMACGCYRIDGQTMFGQSKEMKG